MIGLSDVSSALGAVSDALGVGGGAPAAAAAPGDPKFLRGIHIDQESEEVGGAATPNLPNNRNCHPQIEFIHFGNVHTSYGNLLPHDSYKDNEKVTPLVETARPRGIQFRSALEREAVLLSIFIECAQTVLGEREGMGSLGALASTVGGMFGAGGGGGVKSSELDAPLNKGIAAATKLNAATIEYHDTHQAGMDFHQARTDYRALIKKLVDEPVKPAAGAGLLAALPGTGSIAGPVAGMLKFTQGALFKAADIKIKCFALVAQQQERQIEKACHDMTMAAITALGNPFLPVWCPPAKTSLLAKANALADKLAQKKNLADAFNSAIGDPFGLAPAADPDAPEDEDTQGEEKGFTEVDPPDETPAGGPFVDMAFEVPDVSPDAAEPVPMEMGKLTCQGFIKAIGQPTLPSLVESIVSEVDSIVSEFVVAVYQAILIRSADDPIEKGPLEKSAVETINIVDRIKALTIDKLTFLQEAEKANFSAMGYSLNAGDLAKEANTKIEDLVNDRITPIMDKAIGTAMDEMATQLELARQDSKKTKTYTMEWYLGRLPWVRVSLFYNLFFPFWSALMRCVAEATGGPASAALKAVCDASDKIKGAVDTAKADVDKAQNVITNVGQGVNFLDPNQMSNLTKGAAGTKVLAEGLKPDIPIPRAKFKLPLPAARLTDGKGVDITDYEEVSKKHQWDTATDPDAPATPAADDTATAPPTDANSTLNPA